ncbi:hypothetical protein CTAYLR_006583 [Chrysophaeum taylorii]|uniref:NAD-dependent epimerase/dehydratase domain-containing protein n=1 Tax=Chrysophaeum taylorii TaxID=2483200 RepID=A0AAD7XMQ5_9STRA|nr:hypothetical protein CTAYLR_006583 [Chrysophaeum taylorii]
MLGATHQLRLRAPFRCRGSGLLEYGLGGRSSVSGVHAAVFGATGFLGRYVCSELGREGSRVRAGNRGDEMDARHLKVSFDLGQFTAPYYSPRDEASIAAVIGRMSTVVNLEESYYESGNALPTRRGASWRSLSTVNYSFEELHVDTARKFAKAAREKGCETFVHVSDLAADEASESRYAASKALGEKAVLEEFPTATIIRPGVMFGHEDRFLNWFATMAQISGGFVPLVEDGAALKQPVYVLDVAKAVAAICKDPEPYKGKVFELAGPAEYTLRELAEFTFDITKQRVTLLDTPAFAANFAAGLIEFLPAPLWTRDDVILAQKDTVLAPDTQALTFADLDVVPTPIEKAAFSYLHQYRVGGHFVLAKGYH